MSLIPGFLGSVVFAIVQFLVFLFVLISTPLEHFVAKGNWGNGSGCFTMFGYQNSCRGSYTSKGTEAWGCVKRRDNMNAAGAFAIISIITTLAALVFGILMVIRIPCAVLFPVVLVLVSVLTILISWGCVAAVYGQNMCKGNAAVGAAFKFFTSYGPGFGLMVTAWCFEVVNLILIILLAFC